MRNLIAFLAGLLFAFGLGLSGMTSPAKVLAFLNVRGEWDPSLLFVMVGAIMVYGIGYRLVRRRSRPVLDDKFHVPTGTEITPALLGGSALFGLGWGLAGFCPGPAIVSLTTGSGAAITFVFTLLIGMGVFRAFDRAQNGIRR